MVPKTHEVLRAIVFSALRMMDMALVMIAFGIAAIAGLGAFGWAAIATFLSSKVSLFNCILLAVAILSCYAVFSACGLYRSKRMSTKRSEMGDVLRAMALSSACVWLEGRIFSVGLITPVFLALFASLGSTLIVSARFALRLTLEALRKRGKNLHYILVLGTNSRAIEFGRQIESKPDRGCRLLGFVDDDWSGFDHFQQSGFRRTCRPEELAEFLRRNVVDEVAIYLPLRSFYERGAEMANLAKQHGILLRFDTDIFDLKLPNLPIESIGPAQVMTGSSTIDGWGFLLKRTFDVAGSLALLILLAPVFLFVALLIKMTTPGPVFFTQKRVGLNKREFTMFKFRTMVSNAERIQEKLLHLNEMSGPVFKMKNDPRITPLGRVLRKTSIDELPQLFNVLRGDMSLVGPRAMSWRDYQLFNEDWQRRRFSVPTGITCLWQVMGRNNIPFEQWMHLDMQYIDKWSLWLDFKILAQTIPAVFKGSGAA